MYGRIVGSSSPFTNADYADESGQPEDSPGLAEVVAGEPNSSSSATTAPYSLVSEPPITEIGRSDFMEEVRRFLGNDIRHIAMQPQEYSDFVSEKAERAGTVAGGYASTFDDPDKPARFFSYQLGDETVGLLRMGGPVRIKGERFQQQFGRNDITSVVDLRITHPMVENAGDILLEHQLRIDGDHPLVLSRPALEGMEPRLAEMGFVHVGSNHWVLDPNQHPEAWTKNENDKWQRADRGTQYLSKVEDSDAGTMASIGTDSSEDDPCFYLERALRGLTVG
ncbi:hypothetical protein [Mesorhizobium ciceri]|uniref:hypothetical protein n=1 Tax=Mesorhizobium TaxID=68287 RepID=UPI000478F241|nr:hypothetical protein [Mesorhizobium ciceri]